VCYFVVKTAAYSESGRDKGSLNASFSCPVSEVYKAFLYENSRERLISGFNQSGHAL
jgi:hypothetical protein